MADDRRQQQDDKKPAKLWEPTMPVRVGPFEIITDNTKPIDEETTTILYGPSGIGKSTAAKMWPRPFHVIFRGGGEHRPLPLIGSAQPFVEIFSTNQLDQLMALLAREGLPKDAKGQPCQTIVIDQLPSFYYMNQRHILSTVLRGRENEETFGQSDFRQARFRTHNLFFNLAQLHCHKLYLSLDRTYEDDATKKKDCFPLLPGVLATEIPGFADFVAHMTTKRIVQPLPGGGQRAVTGRTLHFQPYSEGDVSVFAKDSSGRLPDEIESPTPTTPIFDLILQALRKERTTP